MNNSGAKHALMSLNSCFTQKIASHQKTVELRRRRIALNPKDVIWIYTKLPIGKVELRISVREVVADSPAKLYKQYKSECGISKKQFFDYFGEVEVGYAIVLGTVKKIKYSPSLQILREKCKGFHPPQFIKYLDSSTLCHLQSFAYK